MKQQRIVRIFKPQHHFHGLNQNKKTVSHSITQSFEDGKITAHSIPFKSNLKEIGIPNGIRTLKKSLLLVLLRKVLEV